jgi:hypothetical protein
MAVSLSADIMEIGVMAPLDIRLGYPGLFIGLLSIHDHHAINIYEMSDNFPPTFHMSNC